MTPVFPTARRYRFAYVFVVAALLSCEGTEDPSGLVLRRQPIQISGDTHYTDWSEYTTGVQPTGWTQMLDPTPYFAVAEDAATPGNKWLQWSATAASRNRWGLAYDGLGDFADQDVYTEMRVRSLGVGSLYYMGSAAVRLTGTATNEGGYVVWFVQNNGSRSLTLATWANGGYTQLAANSLSWDFDTWYSVRLRAVGYSIQAKVWPRGTPEPANWLMSVNDTRWYLGKPGVANHDNGVVQWDYWSVTALPVATINKVDLEPATLTMPVDGVLQLAATAQYSNGANQPTSVTYSASDGIVTAGGLFTAPSAPGEYRVIATSTVDPAHADTSTLTVVNAPSSLAYNFEQGSIGAMPVAFSETVSPTGSEYTYQNESTAADGRVLRNVTTSTARHVLRADSILYGTPQQELLVRLKLTDDDTRGPGAVVRHSVNRGLDNGYYVYLRSIGNQLEVQRVVNGVAVTLATVPFTIDPGSWYWLRVRADGAAITARAWADGTAEPTTWNAAINDVNLVSGSSGLVTSEANTVYFDAFTFAANGATAPTPAGPPPPTLTQIVLTPATASIETGATQQFTVTGVMSNGTSTTPVVTYTAEGGTIDANGLFTAGSAAGSFAVIATSVADPQLVDTAIVTINAPPPPATLTQIMMTPATATVNIDGTVQFTVSGTMSDGSVTVPSVTYAATGGNVSTSGMYTAASTAGSFVVVATSTANPTLVDTSFVTVNAPPPPPPGGSTYSFSFNDGTNGSPPVGWTETAFPANSAWTIATDATASDGWVLRNVTTVTSRHIFRLDAVPDTATVQEALVKMRLTDSDGRGPGVILRHRMNGTSESGYVAYLRPATDRIEINSFNNAAWGFVSDNAFVNDPGVWYWIRFRAEGSTLRLKVWVDGATEPAAWLREINNTALSAGSVGLYVYEPNTVNYDFVSFALMGGTAESPSNAPPPPAATLTSLSLTPQSATVNAGATLQMQVSGTWSDGSNAAPAVTYAAAGGTVSSAGLFTAGNTAGTFNIIATSVANPALSDTSVVTVDVPPPPTLASISLSPASASAMTGGAVQFSVTGLMSNGSATVPSVTYTATGGTISTSGLYSAGTTAGTFTVIATSTDNPALTDTSVVTLTAPPPSGGGATWFTDFSLGTVGAPMPDLRKMRSGSSWAFNAIVREDPTAPGNKILKLEGPTATTNGASRPHAWLVVPAANEQEVVVKLRTTNTSYASGGAYLSGSIDANGYPSEYGARLSAGKLTLWNYKNNNFNGVETPAPLWVANQWMWLRLRMTATHVMVRYWPDGAAEPTTWNLTGVRNWGPNGSGLTVPFGAAGVYMNTVNSGVEFGAIGAAIDGATAPTSGSVTMGALPEPTTSGALYSTDFAGETIGQVPTSFTAANVTTGITWSIADLGGRQGIRSVGGPLNGARLLDYTPMSDATTDQEVLMRVRPGTANQPHTIGAALRIEDPAGGSNSFYAIAIGAQNLDQTRWLNGSRTALNSGTPITFTTGAEYWIRARVEGTRLMGKFWRSDEPEPAAWFRVGNDVNITSGSAGLLHWQADTVDITHVTVKNN